MAKNEIHSKIITEAARKELGPLGIFQKGRSRTWIDDRGWWIVVIEFQPTSWSKGSYLNAGAMWLWNEKDYYSFDFGHRIASFVKFVDEKQFTLEATKLASAASREALNPRSKFASIHHAARALERQARAAHNPWDMLAAAVALGYVGHAAAAQKWFRRLEHRETTYEWEARLQDTARSFGALLEQPDDFRRRVEEAIRRTRKLLKLPERSHLDL